MKTDTLQRRALIVGMINDSYNNVIAMQKSVQKWVTLLNSAEGGAWKNQIVCEIISHANTNTLKNRIKSMQDASLDYFLMIYIGSDPLCELKDLKNELLFDDPIVVSDKQLLVQDLCPLSLNRIPYEGSLNNIDLHKNVIDNSSYIKYRCKFNELIKNAENQNSILTLRRSHPDSIYVVAPSISLLEQIKEEKPELMSSTNDFRSYDLSQLNADLESCVLIPEEEVFIESEASSGHPLPLLVYVPS